MKSLYQPRFGATENEKLIARRQAEEIIRLRGDNRPAEPPRDVYIQSGSRKAVVTWKAPQDSSRVAYYRIYKDSESSLYATTSDGGVRTCEIAMSAGTTPPTTNIFISSVSYGGQESQRIQAQGSATAETGAPVDPPQPPGFTDEASGGGDIEPRDISTRSTR